MATSATTTNTTTEAETLTTADFAKVVCADARASKKKASLHDCIIRTSTRLGEIYHIAPYEYKQAESEVISLIREPKEATLFDRAGNPVNDKPRGKQNDLLGKKIFPNRNIRGRTPQWAGTAEALPSDYGVVTGTELPIFAAAIKLIHTAEVHGMTNQHDVNWLNSQIAKSPESRKAVIDPYILQLSSTIELKTDVNSLTQKVGELTQMVHLLSRESRATEEPVAA